MNRNHGKGYIHSFHIQPYVEWQIVNSFHGLGAVFDRQLFEYNRVIVIVPLTVIEVLMVMEEQECKNTSSSLIHFTCKCCESIAIYRRSWHNQSFRLHRIWPMPTNHCKKQGENIMIQQTDCRRQKRGVIQWLKFAPERIGPRNPRWKGCRHPGKDMAIGHEPQLTTIPDLDL